MKLEKLSSELFATGRIIREPPAGGKGYWVGTPGAFYAAEERALYLTYRIRRPRGVEPDRGGEARIARSTDFEHFEDVWAVKKDRFPTASIERCAVRKGPDDVWRYFVSMVDPADGRWRVSVIKADRPEAFDPTQAQVLFSAPPLALEGVKDPWIRETPNGFSMYLSVAIRTPKTNAGSHATLDIFNTGECVSATAMATSRDLERWEWRGLVFSPSGPGWDSYCRRLNCVLGDGLGFYDGSASELENYEERTGWATETDGHGWQTGSPEGPVLTSPHASGSLRYLEAVEVAGRVHLFYEYARPDGAHDLRMLIAEMGVANFQSGSLGSTS